LLATLFRQRVDGGLDVDVIVSAVADVVGS